MNNAYSAAWQERIYQACYQHILPHMEKYHAEPNIEQCLPLMEPRIFAAFAGQACCDVARLVTKAAHKQYHHYTRNFTTVPVVLRELAVGNGDEVELRDRLAPCLTDFGRALERYAPVLLRFRQMLGHAEQAAWNNGTAIGEWAGEFFGGMAAVVAAAAGGYIAGSAIHRELQAENAHLQQAFQVMLQAYDQAMTALTQNSLGLIDWHRKELLVAVRNAC